MQAPSRIRKRRFRRRMLLAGTTLVVGLAAGLVGLKEWRMAQVPRVPDNALQTRLAAIYVSQAHMGGRVPGATYYGAFSSQRLPSWLRLPLGWLETLTLATDCDSQVRALVYILAQMGIEARQLDIFGPESNHSVAAVNLDGRWVLVDPYVGLAFETGDGSLATFEDIQHNLDQLKVVELRAGAAKRVQNFYGDLEQAVAGFSGSDVYMPIMFDASGLPLALGQVDKDSEDVIDASARGRHGYATSFLGKQFGRHKHSRVTITDLPQDQKVRLSFRFTGASPAPFPTLPAQACTFAEEQLDCVVASGPDGQARLDLLHGQLSSLHPVDQLVLKPLD